MEDPQVSMMESLSKDSPIEEGSKSFIRNSNSWDSRDDGMMTYQDNRSKG